MTYKIHTHSIQACVHLSVCTQCVCVWAARPGLSEDLKRTKIPHCLRSCGVVTTMTELLLVPGPGMTPNSILLVSGCEGAGQKWLPPNQMEDVVC